ncbi:hypothetical protein BC835DRAFT_178849 [Cytidiella melzeri]|nr:hypothetical protein BC835DRAFT_178849 [Cytidiella melzeri]
MSLPSSYVHWSQPHSQSAHSSVEVDDDTSEYSDSNSSMCSELMSPDDDVVNDEFHEEEFSGILALAELARVSFACSSQTADLEDYIAYLRDALTVAPRRGHARADVLHTLAHNLYLSVSQPRSPTEDSLKRLNESIHYHRLALHYLPDDDEARGLYATRLAVTLREGFARSGNVEDLHECIVLHSGVLSLRPLGHPDRLQSLLNLANGYFTRFECLCDDDDLEQAISFDNEALDLLPPNDSERLPCLLSLAADLGARFGKNESQVDLQRSMALYQEAMLLAKTGQDSLRIVLQLGTLLLTHYRLSRAVDVLDQAIAVCSRQLTAEKNLSETDKLPAVRLLADLCLTQYLEGSREAQYLESAVQYCTQFLQYLPELSSSSNRLDALLNLSYALAARFSRSKGLEDINQAILLCTQAAEMSSPEHPHYSRSLRALARSLAIRYEYASDEQDLQQALTRYEEAVENPYGLVRERISHGEEWVALIFRYRGHSGPLLEAYTSLISLLLHLLYFEDVHQLHPEDTATVTRIMADALHCALVLGDTAKAIELIEQRQEVIWCPRRLDDAIPFPLHQRLHNIARSLLHGPRNDQSLSFSVLRGTGYRSGDIDETACRHRNLVDEFQGLVQHLRQYPGLADFLRPIQLTDFTAQLDHEPVVLLIAQPHCAAIICRSSGASTISLPLHTDELTNLASGFQGMQQGIDGATYGELAGRIWEAVVCPILTSLEYTTIPIHRPKPRVWWCPTGPFTFIPLHAVGDYQAGKQPICTLDYVVSSYTPSIAALRSAERHELNRYTRELLLPTALTTDFQPLLSSADSFRKDDTHVVQIPSPTSSDGLSFSFGFNNYTCHSEGRRAPFIRLTGPLDNTKVTSPDADDSQLLTHSAASHTPPNLTELASSHVAFAFHDSQSLPASTNNLISRLPFEGTHAGFALLSSGFHSIISTVPGWQSLLDASDTAAVIEQVCKDIESADSSDLDPSVVPYALDNAIRSLRNNGVPLLRLIPFIHIGL